MKFLLDTCTFLWIVADDAALTERARGLFLDGANESYLSAVSAWEIVVKHALGRLPLPQPPEHFVAEQRERHGIAPLPLDESAVLHLSRLPPLHRDPFDRMLVCQALAGGLAILTPDESIGRYPVRCVW
jgi:PIN domain nuclease of toxin-antitoxin system